MEHTVPMLALAAIAWPCLADPLPRGDWEAQGLPPDKKVELERFLAGSCERRDTAGGLVLIVHRGKVVFAQAFGYGNIRRQRPFEVSTSCWVASLTKPIVASLLVKLAADGRLDLDAPIDRYLPNYAGIRLRSGKPPRWMPRVRELLKHTAGFTPDKEKGGRPWFWKEARGKTLQEMVELYPVFPIKGLYCDPGRGCWYSGMGYDVAGRIVEVAIGKPFHEVLRQELCEPLGMNDTFLLPDGKRRAQAARRYYQWRSDGSFHYKIPRPPPSAATDGASSPYAPIGGGLLSTAADLAAFLMMHRNSGRIGDAQVIPTAALRQMYSRARPWPRYGMGFVLGPGAPNREDGSAWVMHTGSSGTVFWLDFEHDVIGVVLTQTQRSRGHANVPESEKKIPFDAPTFPQVVKAKIDAIFGWREWP